MMRGMSSSQSGQGGPAYPARAEDEGCLGQVRAFFQRGKKAADIGVIPQKASFAPKNGIDRSGPFGSRTKPVKKGDDGFLVRESNTQAGYGQAAHGPEESFQFACCFLPGEIGSGMMEQPERPVVEPGTQAVSQGCAQDAVKKLGYRRLHLFLQ